MKLEVVATIKYLTYNWLTVLAGLFAAGCSLAAFSANVWLYTADQGGMPFFVYIMLTVLMLGVTMMPWLLVSMTTWSDNYYSYQKILGYLKEDTEKK